MQYVTENVKGNYIMMLFLTKRCWLLSIAAQGGLTISGGVLFLIAFLNPLREEEHCSTSS